MNDKPTADSQTAVGINVDGRALRPTWWNAVAENAARVVRLAIVWKALQPLLPGRGRRNGLAELVPKDMPLAARIANALPRCPAGGVLVITGTGVRASAGKEQLRETVKKAAGPIVIVPAP